MKWLDNIKQVGKNGIVGDCPHCGGIDTDYVFVEYDDGRGYLDIWCNSCKDSVHVDCVTIPHDRKWTTAAALKEEREKKQKHSLAI